jgi:hypothetical protein
MLGCFEEPYPEILLSNVAPDTKKVFAHKTIM